MLGTALWASGHECWAKSQPQLAVPSPQHRPPGPREESGGWKGREEETSPGRVMRLDGRAGLGNADKEGLQDGSQWLLPVPQGRPCEPLAHRTLPPLLAVFSPLKRDIRGGDWRYLNTQGARTEPFPSLLVHRLPCASWELWLLTHEILRLPCLCSWHFIWVNVPFQNQDVPGEGEAILNKKNIYI